MLFASPWGIGSSPSVQYIQAAWQPAPGVRPFDLGKAGLPAPTHFPPLYPLILAVAASSRETILAWAQGLQAILFTANIASLGLIVWICSPRKRWLGALAAGAAICALPILEIHIWAWSEPLFLFLSTWGLFLLYRHLEKPATVFLVSAAGLQALACLARYTGLAVALAGVFSILLLSRKGLRYRFTDSLVFILVSLLPVAIWLERNVLRGVKGTDRLLVYHPLSLALAKTAVVGFTTWLAPMRLPNETRQWLAIFLYCVLVTGIVLLWKRRKTQHSLRPIVFYDLYPVVSYSTGCILIPFRQQYTSQ